MCALFDEVEGPLASPWFQRAPLGVIRRRESRLEDLSGCELVPRILVVVPCRRGFISRKTCGGCPACLLLPLVAQQLPTNFFCCYKARGHRGATSKCLWLRRKSTFFFCRLCLCGCLGVYKQGGCWSWGAATVSEPSHSTACR